MTRGPLLLFGVAALIGLPLIVVALSLLNPQWDILAHLWQTVIPEYISHSLILLVCVGHWRDRARRQYSLVYQSSTTFPAGVI